MSAAVSVARAPIRVAVETLASLVEDAFEGDPHQSLMANLRKLRPEDWTRPPAEGRRSISDILEQPVHLFILVKVRQRWGDDPERYREMGLEFPKE